MVDIRITKNHNANINTLREKLEELTLDLKKKYGVGYTWSGDICKLSGSGLKKGTLTMTDSTVSIEVTLGIMAKLLKPKIEEQINNKLDAAISA